MHDVTRCFLWIPRYHGNVMKALGVVELMLLLLMMMMTTTPINHDHNP
jgi:hypothetical protein